MSEENGAVSSGETSEGIADNSTEQTTEQLTPAEVRKYQLKVDGEDIEVDEDELKRGYGATKAAQKRMSDAAQMRKQAEELIHLLKTDPRKALSHPSLGHDPNKLAEMWLTEQLELAAMSPQQRELMETKQRLSQYEAERKAQDDERTAAENAKLQAHYENEYSNQIIDALQTGGLPKTEATVKSMAQYMSLALDNGLDVSAKDVVSLVREDYQRSIKELFGAADEDTLAALLGDDLGSKASKAYTNKLKKQLGQKNVVDPDLQGESVKVTHTPKMTPDEAKKLFRQRAGLDR